MFSRLACTDNPATLTKLGKEEQLRSQVMRETRRTKEAPRKGRSWGGGMGEDREKLKDKILVKWNPSLAYFKVRFQ